MAKATTVKNLDLNKVITLAIGILVALVIAITLWIQAPAESASAESLVKVPHLPALHQVIRTTIHFLFF